MNDYRSADGVNYSAIAMKPWERVVEQRKTSQSAIVGRAGHALIEKLVSGGNALDEEFFVLTSASSVPDNIITALENDLDLKGLFVYTKTGKEDGRYKNQHAILNELLLNPGKYPVTAEEYGALENGIRNLLQCEFLGMPISTYLSHGEFEKPHFWEQNGVKKKALFDNISEVSIDDIPYRVVFDFKFTHSFYAFESFFRDKYWIQNVHYSEGGVEYNKQMDDGREFFPLIVFLVVLTTEPYWCCPYVVDSEVFERMTEDYEERLQDYLSWVNNGKPNRGFLEYKELKYWRR